MDLSRIIKDNIVLDFEESWSDEIKAVISKYSSVFEKYYDTELIYEKKSNTNKEYYYRLKKNPFQSNWVNAKKKMLKTFDKNQYCIFHCSRLTDFEISKIKEAKILKSLNPKMMEKKIVTLRHENVIDEEECRFLIDNNLSDEKGRKHYISSVLTLNTLRNNNGLKKFFYHWGGEALIGCYENKEELKKKLSKQGTACVVLLKASFSDVNERCHLLIDNFFLCNFKKEKKYLNEDIGCVCTFKRNLELIEIVTEKDCLFEMLTNISRFRH